MSVLTLELPAETEAKLARRAAARGEDVPTYVRGVLDREVAGEAAVADLPPVAERTFEQHSAAIDALLARLDRIAHVKPGGPPVDDSRESIYD